MDDIFKALIENGGANLLSTAIEAAVCATWRAVRKRNPTKAQQKKIEKAIDALLVKATDADIRAHDPKYSQIKDQVLRAPARKGAAKKWVFKKSSGATKTKQAGKRAAKRAKKR